jgi:hypothetical protein
LVEAYLVVVAIVLVVVAFFLLFFFFAVEVVAVFCAKTTVPVSNDRPIAAIMSFFIIVIPLSKLKHCVLSRLVSQKLEASAWKTTLN